MHIQEHMAISSTTTSIWFDMFSSILLATQNVKCRNFMEMKIRIRIANQPSLLISKEY